MAELGEFLVSSESKVPIDVDMLDYDYINKCSDPNKLQAIVELLKSGKEGYYPDVNRLLSSLSSFIIFNSHLLLLFVV